MFLGELFAQAPIDQYPGIAVETVTDSSRYFVIRIQDGTGKLRGHVYAKCQGWRRWMELVNVCVHQAYVMELHVCLVD